MIYQYIYCYLRCIVSQSLLTDLIYWEGCGGERTLVLSERISDGKPFKLSSKPVLPEVVTTQHNTYDVLANIMDISLHCSQNYGALIGILQTKEKTSGEVEDHRISWFVCFLFVYGIVWFKVAPMATGRTFSCERNYCSKSTPLLLNFLLKTHLLKMGFN